MRRRVSKGERSKYWLPLLLFLLLLQMRRSIEAAASGNNKSAKRATSLARVALLCVGARRPREVTLAHTLLALSQFSRLSLSPLHSFPLWHGGLSKLLAFARPISSHCASFARCWRHPVAVSLSTRTLPHLSRNVGNAIPDLAVLTWSKHCMSCQRQAQSMG